MFDKLYNFLYASDKIPHPRLSKISSGMQICLKLSVTFDMQRKYFDVDSALFLVTLHCEIRLLNER